MKPGHGEWWWCDFDGERVVAEIGSAFVFIGGRIDSPSVDDPRIVWICRVEPVAPAGSERDPLVNPEPGDVVRATASQTGHRYVFLVTHAVDDMIYGVAFCVETRHRVDIIRALSSWGDWSNWTDVKVLS